MHKTAFVFFLAAATACTAAEPPEKATFSAWIDTFGGPQGIVAYPQYSWDHVTLGNFTFDGFGYLESAPHETLYHNNLVNAASKKVPWFGAHVEIGGLPGKRSGFAQIGPQLNLEQIPRVSAIFPKFSVAYLPKLGGSRGDNLMAIGQTRSFPISGHDFAIHQEFLNYSFGSSFYGETWSVMEIPRWKRVNPVMHVIWDTSRQRPVTRSYGIRFTFK